MTRVLDLGRVACPFLHPRAGGQVPQGAGPGGLAVGAGGGQEEAGVRPPPGLAP